MSIVFSVPLAAKEWLRLVQQKDYLTAGDYSKEYGIQFIDHSREFWGFDGTIRTTYEDDWIKFWIAIPENIEELDFPIPSAEGMTRILKAGLSITVLAQIFNLMPKEYFAQLPYRQVLVFETFLSSDGGLANFQAGVFYSKLVTEWTLNSSLPELLGLAGFIDQVNSFMFPSQLSVFEYPKAVVEIHSKFYLRLESSHRVGFVIDGSKANPRDFDNGYSASICNPDNPYDQLICIAGLAKLYETVEKYHLGNRVL